MSWRKFLVLTRCLSPNSATVERLRGDRYFGKKSEGTLVSGAKNVDNAFDALFKDVGSARAGRTSPAPRVG